MGQSIVGIDVGGTHTDFLLLGEDGHIVFATKVSTTPTSPVTGILQGLDELPSPENIATYVNGTTIATNALLQHKIPKIALITTKGFRDVLLIRRETKENIYDLYWDRPQSLVPRRYIFEIDERLDYTGKVVRPLDLSNMQSIVEQMKSEGIENIAVCLINAYANKSHEEEVAKALAELYPKAAITLSSEICQEWREFERTYNTVLNAALGPVVSSYLASLLNKIERGKGQKSVFIMQANGGILGAHEVVNRPVLTLNSGVAAGVIGGAYLAGHSGFDKVITLDMGGTSTDMGIVEGGSPTMTSGLSLEWEGTLGFSAVDAKSIGAGGGSIAWLDDVGALHVGPQSAGADPGPACYDKGGNEPTVTDAHVHLGYLNPEMFLGGKVKLDASKAKKALVSLGKKAAVNDKELALGILRIVNTNMLNGLRFVSIEKGYDPREFVLVCYGGTGPLHAAALMRELGVPKALIPIYPGNVSAFGMLAACPMAEASRTLYTALSSIEQQILQPLFEELEKSTEQQLVSSGVSKDELEIVRSLDMRYEGQTYEINVPLDSQSSLEKQDGRAYIAQLFHNEHKRRYTYSNPGEPVMIVHVRAKAMGPTRPLKLENPKESNSISQEAKCQDRIVYFEEEGRPSAVEAKVYRRPEMTYGNRIAGPAIIEEAGSTTLIPPGFAVTVDKVCNLVMETL